MQRLARSHDVIIACTIHQPSAKIFKGFDRLLLLSGGLAAYSGYVSEVESYFLTLDLPIPTQENPADFLLDTVNADFTDPSIVKRVVDSWSGAFVQCKSIGTTGVE